MDHRDGVPGCEEETIDSRECVREGYGLVEIEQHSVFPVALPGFHLVRFAGRVDNLNAIDPFKLCDDFAPDTPCRAQNQDPWPDFVLFLSCHVDISL
jgi:hypothetical protein